MLLIMINYIIYMKKYLFLLATGAVIFASSCKKKELNPQPEVRGTELTFNTNISQLTKSIFNGAEYADNTFAMYAYALTDNESWSGKPSLSNPIMGATNGSAPIEIDFINSAWRANNNITYFWPNSESTSVSFFGYSPYRDGASEATPKTPIGNINFSIANGVTITDYVNTQQRAKVNDLMVASAQLDKKYASEGVVLGKLPIEFNHILTQVVFTVKRLYAYPDVNIKLQNITLKGVESKGTYSSFVTGGASNWSIAADNKLDYIVFNNSTEPVDVAFAKSNVGDPLVMIPQDATNLFFSATYSLSGEGVSDEVVTKELAIGVNWEMNKKVVCNLVIGLNEITFDPVIVDWVEQHQNSIAKTAPSSTIKAINATLESLNTYKSELVAGGNTAQCSFTVNVPSGAAGSLGFSFSSTDNFAVGDVISLLFNAVGSPIPTFSSLPGWNMSVNPTPIVAGNSVLVTLVKI